jgi:hypothetical protein
VKGNSLKGEVAEKLVLTFYKLPQTVPQYLLRLMAYKIEIEKLANGKKENAQEDDATKE